MSELPTHLNPLEELRYALAEADAEKLPHRLTDKVLTAALEVRSPGRSSAESPAIAPLEAFRRAGESMDRLLRSLDNEQWRTPALRDLDVQGLVGHLIGVEEAFIAALEGDSSYDEDADHVASTAQSATFQTGRASDRTLSDWRDRLRQSLELAGTLASEGGPVDGDDDRALGLHGIHLPLAALLVVRAFELWTHEEDVRRALDMELHAPDAQSLQLMTDLALELLAVPMSALMPSASPGSVKVVLTGDGGRTWRGPPASEADGPDRDDAELEVRIVMRAVEFCRLAANRIDPAQVRATISGDASKAQDLFIATTKLALD